MYNNFVLSTLLISKFNNKSLYCVKRFKLILKSCPRSLLVYLCSCLLQNFLAQIAFLGNYIWHMIKSECFLVRLMPDKFLLYLGKKVTGNKCKSFKINERFRNPYNSLMVLFGLTIQASFNPTKILGSKAHRFAHQSNEGAGAQGFLILLARFSCVIATGIKNSSNNSGKAQARNYMQVVNTSNS